MLNVRFVSFVSPVRLSSLGGDFLSELFLLLTLSVGVLALQLSSVLVLVTPHFDVKRALVFNLVVMLPERFLLYEPRCLVTRKIGIDRLVPDNFRRLSLLD